MEHGACLAVHHAAGCAHHLAAKHLQGGTGMDPLDFSAGRSPPSKPLARSMSEQPAGAMSCHSLRACAAGAGAAAAAAAAGPAPPQCVGQQEQPVTHNKRLWQCPAPGRCTGGAWCRFPAPIPSQPSPVPTAGSVKQNALAANCCLPAPAPASPGRCTGAGSQHPSHPNRLPCRLLDLLLLPTAASLPLPLPHLADALVAHAHTKHGEAAGAQLLNNLQANAAVLGPAWNNRAQRTPVVAGECGDKG